MSTSNELYYDFHMHSCLSPCGDNDMTPNNMAGMAALKELDAIALTDHNSCRNCGVFMKAAEKYGICAIPGMEVCTEEEIHVICLFPVLLAAEEFSRYIYEKTPNIKNNVEIYGHQYITDENDQIIDEEPKLLVNACSVSVMKIPELVKLHNGVCFPAHIDKKSYSILSVLGTIPEECGFKTAEISKPQMIESLCEKHELLRRMNIMTNSDAHYLWDISERYYYLDNCTKKIENIIDKLNGGIQGGNRY
jgi:Predicted metal-dependent phosphoesterases (PHP family)